MAQPLQQGSVTPPLWPLSKRVLSQACKWHSNSEGCLRGLGCANSFGVFICGAFLSTGHKLVSSGAKEPKVLPPSDYPAGKSEEAFFLTYN